MVRVCTVRLRLEEQGEEMEEDTFSYLLPLMGETKFYNKYIQVYNKNIYTQYTGTRNVKNIYSISRWGTKIRRTCEKL